MMEENIVNIKKYMENYINKFKDKKFIKAYVIIILLAVLLFSTYWNLKNIPMKVTEIIQDEINKQIPTTIEKNSPGSSFT